MDEMCKNCAAYESCYDTPPDPQHGREPDKVKCIDCLNGGMGMQCAVCGTSPSTDNPIDCTDFEPRPQGTPAESRYGRDVKSDKVKPLAQYLVDYLQHEHPVGFNRLFWKRIIEQALDAYESTEQVKIRIERI